MRHCRTWDEFEKEIFTPEEIEESDKRVAEISRTLREVFCTDGQGGDGE